MSPTPGPSRRAVLRAGVLTAGSVAALSACSTPAEPSNSASTTTGSSGSPSPGTPTTPVDSWAPKPARSGRLSMVALQKGNRLVLNTADGPRSFLAGVGLSAALPGHLPGEFAPVASDYRRWLGMMGDLGVRVVRLDALGDPALYVELRRYNEAHPDAPLYLMQGISLPSLSRATDEAYGPKDAAAMRTEIADTSAAVHGDLDRRSSPSGPSGRWTADVSGWVAGWLLGDTWAPTRVRATDRHAPKNTPRGTYVAATKEATATEAWLAGLMNDLATAEAGRGTSAPIAVANQPATDPLEHPDEPADGDLVGIDVDHIEVLQAWPAGSFAAYAADPFAPKFLLHQGSYAGPDPYRAYLTDLVAHHDGLPVMITRFGVPASLGMSDYGPLGRHNGFKTEEQALQTNADLLTMFKEIGLAGGLLTSWQDDWSAVSAPTEPRSREVAPERRVMWHDPLSSEQWLGLLAHDPARVGERVVHDDPQSEMTKVVVDHDASWLYLTFFFTRRVTSPVDLGFSLYGSEGLRLPGGSGEPEFDIALRFIPTMSTVSMYVRRTLDPTRLDGLPTLYLSRANARGWVLQQLTMAPPLEDTDGSTIPAEKQKVGELLLGSWDPADSSYNSLATWQLVRPDPSKPMEWRLRLPWSLLGFADPSARQGLVPDLGEPTLARVRSMKVMIESSTPGSPARFEVAVPGWAQTPKTTERLRAGTQALGAALAQVHARDQGD